MADAGFDEFYQGSRQRLLGYDFLLTGDLAEAQDVVQEAYMRAWQHWSTIHRYDEPESWLRTTTSTTTTAMTPTTASTARAEEAPDPLPRAAGQPCRSRSTRLSNRARHHSSSGKEVTHV